MNLDEQKVDTVVEDETEETVLVELTKKVKELQTDLDKQTKEFERDKKGLVQQILDGGKVVEVVKDETELKNERTELIQKLDRKSVV